MSFSSITCIACVYLCPLCFQIHSSQKKDGGHEKSVDNREEKMARKMGYKVMNIHNKWAHWQQMLIIDWLIHTFIFVVVVAGESDHEDYPGELRGQTHTPSIAFWHLPPNSARAGYTTEGALLVSVQLSTHAVCALQKVWVLIRLWKQHGVWACTETWVWVLIRLWKQQCPSTHVNISLGANETVEAN